MLAYLNGEFLPPDRARVPVDDRGFLFGDGVYEVTRAVRGVLFQEEAHWQRLTRGLRELRIGPLDLEMRDIREISKRLLRENGLAERDATVYLQVTRGAAPRTHWFPADETRPTVYLSAAPFNVPLELRRDGVSATLVPDQRWSRCDIKTVNLLPNVMAKQHAKERGFWEALLVRDGVLLEGSSSNLFAVVDGTLVTYPSCNYILPGVTRSLVLELARELDIPTCEGAVYLQDLDRTEELFFTGTTTDVQPVVEVDGQPIGSGTPGPVARALQEALYRRMELDVPSLTA